MAEIQFFAKQGCSRSRQQGTALEKAGNEVQWCDLHTVKWTQETLRPYVRGRRPLEIMDCRAAAIKNGEIDPLLLTWEEALALLAESPDLIKGPLVRVDNLHIQGGNDPRIGRYLDAPHALQQKPTPTKASPNLFKRTRAKLETIRPWQPLLKSSFA